MVNEKEPVRINTRLSYDTNAWLDKKSRELAVSKSALVAMAVENYRKESSTVEMMPLLLEKMKELGVKVEEK